MMGDVVNDVSVCSFMVPDVFLIKWFVLIFTNMKCYEVFDFCYMSLKAESPASVSILQGAAEGISGQLPDDWWN